MKHTRTRKFSGITPVTDLADLAADFWPEDETADDINTFIARQRASDRFADQ